MTKLTITISKKAELSFVNDNFDEEVCDFLTIKNPKYLDNQRMGRWQGDTPKELKFYEFLPSSSSSNDGLHAPRGAVESIIVMCKRKKIKYEIIDNTLLLPSIDFHFSGTLKSFQINPTKEILKHDIGTLCAPTGSGKTVMGLYVITKRKQPALIIVHTKELLFQWIERIENFLHIPKEEIGVIGNSEFKIGEEITVALIQTLKKLDEGLPFGHIIVDECHRTPSKTFYETLTNFDPKYILGLSATPYRRDSLTDLIWWYVGKKRYEIKVNELIDEGHITKIRPIIRKTNFISRLEDPAAEYTTLLTEIAEDRDRNKFIINDVIKESEQGETCLVMTDRKYHCDNFADLLEGYNYEILTGDVPNNKRIEIVKKINQGEVNIVIATMQLIGEGFDCKELSAIFLATPIRFKGRVIQYIGRILRPAEGKEYALIYDYHDYSVRCLSGAFKERLETYKQYN